MPEQLAATIHNSESFSTESGASSLDLAPEKPLAPQSIEEFRQQRVEQAASKTAAFESWKQEQQERETIARRAAYEAHRATQPVKKPLTDEQIGVRQQRTAEATSRQQTIDRQLDTEELHANLGKKGLRRLLHPFRNAKILATVGNRIRKGEYDPRLTQPKTYTESDILNHFEDDPLESARLRRKLDRAEAERRSRLIHPFED